MVSIFGNYAKHAKQTFLNVRYIVRIIHKNIMYVTCEKTFKRKDHFQNHYNNCDGVPITMI